MGASALVHASSLVCANDVTISGHVIEDILNLFAEQTLKESIGTYQLHSTSLLPFTDTYSLIIGED